MFFLTPRHVKHGKQFIKDARKLVAYKRDLVAPEVVTEVEAEIDAMEAAVKTHDAGEIDAQAHKLDTVCGKLTKRGPDDAWRENVEVFLVAIVIALAVRTYFLQPFTIPTGSMQPTLNGIIFHEQKDPPPNVLLQAAQVALFGRDWINVVAQADETVVRLREFRSPLPFVSWKAPKESDRDISEDEPVGMGFFTRTELITDKGNRYVVKAARETLTRNMQPRQVKAGEPIIRGYFDTGDHVFVDKISYHFRKPSRADVFVFSTANIPLLNRPGTPSQFYIKRLAGVPGDTLRIDPPKLYVNGKLAEEPAIQRVMSGTRTEPHNDYRGYGNGAERGGRYDQAVYIDRATNLGTPEATFTVPEKTYVALGDNSYNSLDSRYWGPVPEKNVMGRGVIVYWPFGSHWGFIK